MNSLRQQTHHHHHHQSHNHHRQNHQPQQQVAACSKSGPRAPSKEAMDLQVQMKALCEAADQYLTKRGYSIEQVNGQRISILKEANQELQDEMEECEVFVGKLPRDMFEMELLPALERAGTVYKIRHMMDFSGSTRGFAFVKYMKPEQATLACKILRDCHVRPNCPPIGVKLSKDVKRLFMDNLPIKCTQERLFEELSKICWGVKGVTLSEISPNSDKRHAYVRFKNHKAATEARRLLVPGDVKIYNRSISVDWVKSESPPPAPRSLQAPPTPPTSSSSGHSPTASNQLNTSYGSANHGFISTDNSFGSSINVNNNNMDYDRFSNHQSDPFLLSTIFQSPAQSRAFREHQMPDRNILNNNNNDLIVPNCNSHIPISHINSSIGSNDLLPPESILGETAKKMLDYFPQLSHQSNVVTISNINPAWNDLDRLKRIFQLAGRLKINAIYQSGPGSVTIVYNSSAQADLIQEALSMMPECFARLAQPNHVLLAHRA